MTAILSSESLGAPVPMRVRQRAFDLEFKVYRTNDMPANWFKTYDGYYVTKRIDNNWVYGQRTMDGMRMTDILVGSADPSGIPELNEAYTYVAEGSSPVYNPPAPSETEPLAQIPPELPAKSPDIEPLPPAVSSQKVDVFALAENASPQELRDAVSRGADFNVNRGTLKDEDSDSAYDAGETPLHSAAASNRNPESIRFLLSQGINVNAYAYSGAGGRMADTPLSLAVKNNNIEAVKVLLNNGADPNGWTGEGKPVNMFMLAADSESQVSAKQIAELLIHAGGNINLHDEYSREEVDDVVTQLRDGSLSMANESVLASSRTALIYAVMNDDPDGVNLLLDLKADPDIAFDLVRKIRAEQSNVKVSGLSYQT